MRDDIVAMMVVVTMAGACAALALDTVINSSESAAPPPRSATASPEMTVSESWGFEPGEGFVPGWIGDQEGWTAIDNFGGVDIDTANPHSGTQHLRISYDPDVYDAMVGARSPWVPDPTPDASSMSVWIAIGASSAMGYGYHVRAVAPSQGAVAMTASADFRPDGHIWVWENLPGSGWTTVDTGVAWTPGAYVQLEIAVDPAGDTITYRYGGSEIYSQSVAGGTVIEQVIFSGNELVVGDYADLDDLVIDRGSVDPILHRWAFTTDGTDSVGGADAVLRDGASVGGGALVLDGVDDHAELPIADTLRLLTNVSVEAWVTWTGGRSWERIFDFGNGTEVNWFMTPSASQTGRPRVAITTGGNPAEQQTDSSEPFPLNRRTHVVFTLKGDALASQFKLYMDGILAGTDSEAPALDPAELGLLANLWLGRSQYSQDPYFMGEIDELVIYGTVLSDVQVLELYSSVFADGFESGNTSGWVMAAR